MRLLIWAMLLTLAAGACAVPKSCVYGVEAENPRVENTSTRAQGPTEPSEPEEPAESVKSEETTKPEEPADPAVTEPEQPREPQDPPAEVLLKGWQEAKPGQKQYYKNGKPVTGFAKIGKRYYYFDKSGIMQTKTVKDGKTTYYLSSKGIAEAYKTGKTYYYPNGKKMGAVAKNDFITLQRAKKIAAKVTTSKMTKKQKLEACFKWVMKKHYRMRRSFKNKKGWPAVYANDHFQGGGGDCRSDAAAFAYLAKALGYKKVYVCCDSKKSADTHSWTEINGKVYDPLFAQSKSYKNNYGVKYGVYKLRPALHIKL